MWVSSVGAKSWKSKTLAKAPTSMTCLSTGTWSRDFVRPVLTSNIHGLFSLHNRAIGLEIEKGGLFPTKLWVRRHRSWNARTDATSVPLLPNTSHDTLALILLGSVGLRANRTSSCHAISLVLHVTDFILMSRKHPYSSVHRRPCTGCLFRGSWMTTIHRAYQSFSISRQMSEPLSLSMMIHQLHFGVDELCLGSIWIWSGDGCHSVRTHM